jgi:hypothetical protein
MDDDNEIDFIPLAEVTSVDEMCGMEEVDSDQTARKWTSDRRMGSKGSQSSFNLLLQDFRSGTFDGDGMDSNESMSQLFVNAFQIATISDGYNSGRSYYLQADSGEVKQQIISQLKMLAKNAKKKAEVKSSFRKTQDRVRSVYVARPFQAATALLIVAVNPRCPPSQFVPAAQPSCATRNCANSAGVDCNLTYLWRRLDCNRTNGAAMARPVVIC